MRQRQDYASPKESRDVACWGYLIGCLITDAGLWMTIGLGAALIGLGIQASIAFLAMWCGTFRKEVP